ncbi:MAG: DUF4251 domain-containing protein [Paludibacteraceae bacterium]|nr:DUF4251 domain-containing protein [Paludibacteraceae bacterium]
MSLLFALAVILWSSCATSEEKAAQMAELSANVTNALNNRDYKIAVDRMYPMRGSSRHVSYGYSVEVRNDTLISYLPYFGRAYNVPYGGGKGLNFSAPIGSYQEFMKGNGQRHIEIGVTNDEDTYFYTIEVFDNGSSSVDVRARQRERISYSGNVVFE